jgi:hypothetical protein
MRIEESGKVIQEAECGGYDAHQMGNLKEQRCATSLQVRERHDWRPGHNSGVGNQRGYKRIVT